MKRWPGKQLKNSLTKQLLVFSICIMLSLLAAFLVTNRYVRNSVRKNTLALNEKILYQIEGKLSDYSERISDIAMALSYSPTTKVYFEQDVRERVISRGDLETVFANIMLLEDDIVGIGLYDMDGRLIAETGRRVEAASSDTVLKNQMEFSNLFYAHGNPMEISQQGLTGSQPYSNLNRVDTPYYQVYCPVFDLESQQYGRQIGMSILLMKTDGMHSLLTDSEATRNAEIYLLDENAGVIAQSGGSSMERLESGMLESDAGYLVQDMDTAMERWHVVSRIPQSELLGDDSGQLVLIAAVYGISGILFMMLIYFCYQNLIKRIYQVDFFIQGIAENPDSRMEAERDDEIGRVIRSLNQMLDDKAKMDREMQESQKRMYEIELAKKQLQVLAYRNQINPHFLYNTFECIRGMALYHDMDEIAEITMALSKVFRFAVKEDNIVTVEDEINYIREYATIIEYRFMGKIEVDIDADVDLYPNKVIKLMLQPLVENAVFHGLEQKMGDGGVQVIVRRKWENFIMFLVQDNGCGMDEEQLRHIRENLDDKMGRKGIGLANIYQRLKLFYGEQVVFEIKSRLGEGTKVMVVVPDHVEER